jgi:G3E family GTPase
MTHHDEVETLTIYSGGVFEKPLHHHSGSCDHTQRISEDLSRTGKELDHGTLTKALQDLSKESIWRVKGFVRLIREDYDASTVHILNWAFGRYELSAVRSETGSQYLGNGEIIRLTVMGERGEVEGAAKKLAGQIGARIG